MSDADVKLPPPRQVKLSDLTPRARKQLLKEAHAEVEPEIWAHYLGAWEGLWETFQRKMAEADRIIADNRPRPLSRSSFRKILACLHPDHCNSEHASEALQMFMKLERLLVTPDPPPLRPGHIPLPTVEQMFAMVAARDERRRRAQEEQRTRAREARKAARQAQQQPMGFKRGN